jgi:type III restriction enzyme
MLKFAVAQQKARMVANNPDNPILNSPFGVPDRYWRLDESGGFSQIVEPGRPRSEYFVPIARTSKKAEQGLLALDETDAEGREFTPNDLVNEVRSHVSTWRQLPLSVSYDPDEIGMFSPEYANVFGIPFAFAERKEGSTTFVPPKPTRHVRALPERAALEIRLPRVQGYRVRLPKDPFPWVWDNDSNFTLSPDITPTRAKIEDVLGHGETVTLDNYMEQRPSTVAFHVAGHTLRTRFRDDDGNLRPWLFPQLLRATREWLDKHLTCVGGTKPGLFLWKGLADEASLRIYNAHVRGWQMATKGHASDDLVAGELLPIIDPYNPMGSSRFVDFRSSKPVWETAPDLCHVNFVVGDSD